MTKTVKNKTNKLTKLTDQLRQDYPGFKFQPAKRDHWSPRFKTVFYKSDSPEPYGLLHELAHALLGHANYTSDFELIRLEGEAWGLAEKIGKNYGVDISDDYIQNCLDTYRDWLHRRSTCPACNTHVLQKDAENYHCYNCQTDWAVSSGRFLRPYRRKEL